MDKLREAESYLHWCSNTTRLANAMVIFDINRIQRIALKGDDLESVQYTWTMAMSELATAPDPAILQYCYLRHIQSF